MTKTKELVIDKDKDNQTDKNEENQPTASNQGSTSGKRVELEDLDVRPVNAGKVKAGFGDGGDDVLVGGSNNGHV